MLKLYLSFLQEEAFPIPLQGLSSYRREKLARQKNEHVRRLSALAELLLRHALKESGYALPPALEIRTGEQGKPYLADGFCFFNLSHSGNAALCVVGKKELGADIQILVPAKETLMRRFYAPDEREYVRASSSPDAAFTEIWTKKESYCKASGLGLSAPLASFSVLDESIVRHLRHGTTEEYHVCVYADEDELPESLDIAVVENSALL